MELLVKTLNELDWAAKQIINYSSGEKIFLFYGEMGAGKTTLIKSLCSQLGVVELVSSPTFSIVNEYAGTHHKIFHFDFYRLKNQNEAYDMGYEEYFYSGNYCLIEWPEKIPGLLPLEYLSINIEVMDNKERKLILRKP